MSLMIYIEQPLPRDVGVDLGRGQISVSEQFLDAAEVGTAVQQVGREAVPEGMRAGGIVESGRDQMILEQPSDAAGRQPGSVAVQEDGRLLALAWAGGAADSGRSSPSPSGRPG